MSIRKASAVLLALATLLIAAASAQADYKTKLTLHITAASPVYDEVYTLAIPNSLAITQSGWNSIGNITASYGGTNAGFDTSKKLVITATSTHTSGSNFYLASTTAGVTDTISYFVATGQDDTGAKTTFEFSAAEINTEGGTSKPIGVNVENYSNKSAGNYEDEITYTVSVESAVTTRTVTWTASDITSNPMTKDGVTLSAGSINTDQKDINNGGTFMTASGNLGYFTKIEITAYGVDTLSGDGWSKSSGNKVATWTNETTGMCTGVAFNGNILQVSKIVFTIEE